MEENQTVECPNRICGKVVSVKFAKCPFCGTPLRNTSPKEEGGKVVISAEREEITLSTTSSSIALIAIMCFPLIVILVMGAWIIVGRLGVALLLGVLAIIYSRKADKKAVEKKFEKAVKAAKNAKGFNIAQIIYGIFSWIALIRLILGL